MALEKIRRTPGRSGVAHPTRSRAFFLELLVNMLIFSLCAVVILLVFLEGKTITDEARALTQLSLDAETLAEEYKVYGYDIEELLLLDESGAEGQSGVVAEDGSLTYHYNRHLALSHPQEAVYTLVVEPSQSSHESVKVIKITAQTHEKELFNFEVSYYQSQGRG